MKPLTRRGQASDFLVSGALILLVSALTYLPLAGQLGYYRDDWHVAWGGMLFGPAKIIDLHLIDRPLMGVLYGATYSVLGDSPLAWQLYAVGLRAAGALLFLWLLRMIWPGRQVMTALMALLFAVYPGFLQIQTASAYSNHLVGLAMGIASIGLSVLALRETGRGRRALLMIGAVLTGLVCFFIMEYMISLELVRGLVFGYLLLRDEAPAGWWNRTLALLKRWAPYLIGLGAFLFWRVAIFKSARSATDVGSLAGRYLADPIGMAGRVVYETVRGTINALALAWGVPLYNLTLNASPIDILISVGLAALAVGLAEWFLRKAGEQVPAGDPDRWAGQAVLLGLAVIVVNLAPIALAERTILLTDTFDRYTLPASIGVVMVVIGFLYRWVRPPARVPVALALLAISVVTQYHDAAFFRNFWKYQRTLWWQLSWRAPALAENTLIIPSLPAPYALSESYEVWGPANLIYASREEPFQVAGEALNSESLNSIISQTSFTRTMRRVTFTLDFKNMLLVSIPTTTSCMHVLNGEWQEIAEGENPLVRLAVPYAREDLILTEGEHKIPLREIFGAEPEHGWCYYYQSAALARQRGDWEEAARLGDEAAASGLQPQDASEWMPFYQAYAYTNAFDQANQIASQLRADQVFVNNFCSQFSAERMAEYRPGSTDEYIVLNLCQQ